MGFSIFRFQRCGACLVRQAVNRQYSGRKSFIQDFISKVKEEYQQDKDMKANLKKFREETEKLEKSDEIQKVRQYYKKIEKEIRTDTSDKLRDAVSSAKDRVSEEFEDIRKQEYVKKGLEGVSKVSETVSKTAQSISEADIVQKAKEGVKAVEQELDSERRKIYRPPDRLKTRFELAGKIETRIIEADEESMGMVLHKDSKWYAAWSDFKDNNQYMQKFFDMKTKYDESENLMIRSTRFVTDRVSQLFGGVFSNSEMADVLTEITKIDSSFSLEEFLRFCRFDIIPNVLEGDLLTVCPLAVIKEMMSRLKHLHKAEVYEFIREFYAAAVECAWKRFPLVDEVLKHAEVAGAIFEQMHIRHQAKDAGGDVIMNNLEDNVDVVVN